MDISDRLVQVMGKYHREAHRCARARAYLAAIVMQVAAFEAGLHAMCCLYPEEVKKTAIHSRKKFRGKRNKALEFSLYQLIGIADELGWFPPERFTWAGKRATIAGFAHEVRQARNLVHPGEWARQRDPLKFTKGIYDVAYEVIDVANSWLQGRVEESLAKAVSRKQHRN